MTQIKVGISDLNIATNGDSLVTFALGSCVGICIYDNVHKIAGLSHIMLPASSGFNAVGDQKHKFADLAIPELVKQMEYRGAKRICMKAKIAGGAKMFATPANSPLGSIGDRNVVAVKYMLGQLRIPIIAEDTGKDYGRTQYFDSATGLMKIKSVNRGEATY
ncbi:MAG: chemotaxis protein CheD [Clostridia bacterium]